MGRDSLADEDASRRSLTLVVPLYDEHERFGENAAEFAAFINAQAEGSELVFVDDGSTDDTPELVEKFIAATGATNVRLLRRPHLGKGAAVRAGLALAGTAYAGFCDVDLSTPLGQFDLIAAAAQMGRVLAIGSRDVATSRLIRSQSAVREFLGKSYNRLIQFTLAPGIVDTQCGAKVASVGIWQELLVHSSENGFAWDVEIIALARRLGVGVQEVAIEWSHDDRSKVRVGRDGTAMVLAVPRILRTVAGVPGSAWHAADASGVFETSQAETLMRSDTAHWWFLTKASLVSWALRRHLGTAASRDLRLVDAGSGAGGVSAMLGWRPDRLFITDGSFTLCREAKERHALLAAVADLERLPYRPGSTGVVTLLDVIEHLDDPAAALGEAWSALAGGGLVVVNVPAHPWLWSGADEFLGHVRRYTRPLLQEQLEAAGFDVVWISHVFAWLVPPLWLRRRLATDRPSQLGLDISSPMLTRIAMVLSRLERFVVARVPSPLGTSILCVARKAVSAPQGRQADRQA